MCETTLIMPVYTTYISVFDFKLMIVEIHPGKLGTLGELSTNLVLFGKNTTRIVKYRMNDAEMFRIATIVSASSRYPLFVCSPGGGGIRDTREINNNRAGQDLNEGYLTYTEPDTTSSTEEITNILDKAGLERVS